MRLSASLVKDDATPERRPPVVLNCRGVDAGYGRPVVRGFDLELRVGEIVALLGPNSAGKTTVLSTLAGLLRSLGGTVELFGSPAPLGKPRKMSRAGVVLVRDDRALSDRSPPGEHLAGETVRGPRRRSGPRLLPRGAEAAQGEGRCSVRRRAGDGRHRTGPRAAAEGTADRRTVHGPGPGYRRQPAADRPAGRRRDGHRCHPRGAARPAGAGRRRLGDRARARFDKPSPGERATSGDNPTCSNRRTSARPADQPVHSVDCSVFQNVGRVS